MKICSLNDLQETGAFGFEHDGQSCFAILAEDGMPRIYKNSCPHLGIQLEMMPDQFLDAQGEFIVCANHGALFELDKGLCVAGPCRNQHLQQLSCELKGSEIFLVS